MDIMLLFPSLVLLSCLQAQNPALDNFVTVTSTKEASTINVHTRHEYTNTLGDSVIIENSYPRGGQTYTHANGERYVYAVFWSQKNNNTQDTLKMTLGFLKETYQLPSSSDRVFKLLLPSEAFNPTNEMLPNYGLDVKRFLDKHLYSRTKVNRTVWPKDSVGFYVVSLFNRGVEGTLRTGLKITVVDYSIK